MMPHILIVDDTALVRDPIAAMLRTHGFSVAGAGNGADAFAAVGLRRPDVIVLDMNMPDIDGLAFLRTLRNRIDWKDIPVLVLSANMNKDTIRAAAQLGIHGYLLKDHFSIANLVERIDLCLTPPLPAGTAHPASHPEPPAAPPARAPAPRAPNHVAPARPAPLASLAPAAAPPSDSWPRLLTRDQTLARLDAIADGKTIAGVVSQVISLASSPNTDLSDIVRIINTDPILASRVLQLANSPAFSSSRGRISSVDAAARNVGLRAILNMALSIGIFAAFPPDEIDGFNSMRCWQHSFAVADIMTLFVREHDPLQEGANHLIGLCHDLGEILLRQHFADVFHQILRFATTHHLPPHAVEAAALGIRHPELLSRLLSRIGLPQPVVHAIREFYERQVRDQAAGLSPLALGLLTANQIAHGLLLVASPLETVNPITRTEWRLLGGDKLPPVFDPQAKRTEILTATNILARLPIKEEQRLIAPILRQRDLRLLYLRSAYYVDLDPLAYALGLLADLTIANQIPSATELAGYDAIITVALRPNTPPFTLDDIAHALAAADAPSLPVLALTATGDASANTPPTVTHATYPISLHDLDLWLSAAPADPARHQEQSQPTEFSNLPA
jgi:HD-like signal output (HDOD) protein